MKNIDNMRLLSGLDVPRFELPGVVSLGGQIHFPRSFTDACARARGEGYIECSRDDGAKAIAAL